MYLPRCYYTPGEYFFLYFVFVILMQDISHDLETWWHTVDQREKEREPALCHSHWRMRAMCVLSELSRFPQRWAAHRVSPRFFNQTGPLSPPACTPFCSPLLINSGFVHLLCCMFVSAAKERSVQAPQHTCIYKRTQIILIGIKIKKRTVTYNWISLTHIHTQTKKSGLYNQPFFFFLPSVYKSILCAEEGD